MGLFEDGAGAGKAKTILVEGDGGRDLGRHGRVGRRAERATKVADVTAHEDEGRRCRASKARDVTHGMTRDVEDVEAAVAEEVVRGVLADLGGRGIEGNLMHRAPSMLVRVPIQHQAAMRRAYSKSLSSIGESFLPGYPGMNASLKPGPTYRSADLGNSETSPVWSQCQWLQMTPSTLLSSSPPSLRISLMLLGTFRPGMPFLMEACAAGAWFHQSLRQPRSNYSVILMSAALFLQKEVGAGLMCVSRAIY